MADLENGGESEYLVNGKRFTNKDGSRLDSLANRLRDLQHSQTLEFKKQHSDIPVDEILKNEESDTNFKNTFLDQKADSLRSKYGDRKIAVDQDFKKTHQEYKSLTDATGIPISNVGEKEEGLEYFGYRSMLQKYPHKKEVPAYKTIEGKEKPTLEKKVKNQDNKWKDNYFNALKDSNSNKKK